MKTTYFLLIALFVSFFQSEFLPQSFYTGGIGVTIGTYGRVRVFSDNLITRQIDRNSLLVGVSQTAVFDYLEDAENVVPPSTVITPLLSDFEATVTIDNSYSNLPPDVTVLINVYGWTNAAYLLVKMNITNNATTSINAVLGAETIPQIDGTYENDFIQYNAGSQMVLMNEAGWVGWKLFAPTSSSFNVIDWFSGYENDSSFYAWLTQNSFNPPLTTTSDGAVAVQGTQPLNLEAGASTDFYYGISVGTDQASCISNMDACEAKYNQIVPVELALFTATSVGNTIELSWNTASELNNLGFEIQRKNSADQDWISIGFREGKGTVTETQYYSYLDDISHLQQGNVSYRLKQIDLGGTYSFSNIVNVEINPFPNQVELMQNYPNPFNPKTTIKFGIPAGTDVSLKVFNSLGEEVGELINEFLSAGTYNYNFDASNLPSGIYVFILQTGEKLISKKMILLK